jgi:hypothetical protein
MKPDYPVFKGMDLQNKKYLISIMDNGVFICSTNVDDSSCDVEFTWDELVKLRKSK